MHNLRRNLQRIIVFLIPLVALVAYGFLFLYPLEGKDYEPATEHVTGDSIAPWPAHEQALLQAMRISPQAKESQPDEHPDLDALLETAREQGRVRVLAQLAVPFQADGLLGPRASAQQQQVIAQAQDRVLQALSNGQGARLVRRYTYTPLLALELDEAALRAASRLSTVKSIHVDEYLPPALADSIPLINADQAWASGYTGDGWTVAVLDTGVDSSHPFLAGKVVSEACFSTNDAGITASSLCPNGQETQLGPGSGANCAAGIYGCNHGTHVAGIVAGSNATFSGVARDATIIAIQVFTRVDSAAICFPASAPCALTATSDYIAGLDHVYGLRNSFDIAAANMSLGGGQFASYCDSNPSKPSIDTLRSAGIATVIASGNNGFTNAISAPACISTAVSVGNTTKSDAVASSSNSANFLDLLAPGTSIQSSIPGGNYAAFTGTSMAAPHVAGAWALYKEFDPSASVTEILNNFVSTGISITDGRNGLAKSRLELDFFSEPVPTPTPGTSYPMHLPAITK